IGEDANAHTTLRFLWRQYSTHIVAPSAAQWDCLNVADPKLVSAEPARNPPASTYIGWSARSAYSFVASARTPSATRAVQPAAGLLMRSPVANSTPICRDAPPSACRIAPGTAHRASRARTSRFTPAAIVAAYTRSAGGNRFAAR